MVLKEKIWEVVLGGGNGEGVQVTEGEDEASSSAGRLRQGTLVRELAPPRGSRHILGKRVHYSKVSGSGPQTGWVTTSLKEKDFLVRTYDVRAADLAPADTGAALAKPAGGERPYDVIIYGASGFTGTLAAEHLDAVLAARGSSQGRALRWAVAGRKAAKLRPLEKRCKTGPTVFQVEEPEELAALAANCRVLIAAAGPYQLFGEAAVKACVQQGTHYVDVTGETPWVREMIGKYHEEARRRGVMVVHCAGQICTIDEINCYLLAKQLGPLRQFREYFSSYGAMTGGTFATNVTTMQGMTPESFKVLQDPFNLGGQRKCGLRKEDRDCDEAVQDPLFSSMWLQPAYSTTTGSRVIRRTCQLFEETPGDKLQYGEQVSVTIREAALSQKAAESGVKANGPLPSYEVAAMAAAAMSAQVASGQVPQPGQGPPPETRALYFSDVYSVAEGENGQWAHVHYTGPEAYEVTAMCCVTAALCLAEEADRLKPHARGGVLTPAYAMHGSTFVQRLQETTFAGRGGRRIAFEVLEGRPQEEALKKAIQERARSAAMGQDQIMKGQLKAFT